MHVGRGGPNPGLLVLVRVPLTRVAALRAPPAARPGLYQELLGEGSQSDAFKGDFYRNFSNPTSVSRGSATCVDPD